LRNISGRSKKGYKIIRTKKKNKNNFFYVYYNRENISLGLILNLCYSNLAKTFLFFVKNSQNQFFYLKGINGLFLSDYVKSLNINPRYLTTFFLGFNILLRFCKKGFIISNILLNSKNRFIKSPGTYGQVIDIIDELDLIIIRLPSLKKKIFNSNNLVTVGRNIFIDKKYQFYSKAGILKNNGSSSIVRGVAMNPVDHPHGGRTKTNSPEVSI
jgi:large subunit ribosomal protein L2